MYKIQFVYNGKKRLAKQRYESIERAIIILDRLQAEWTRNQMPQVLPGEFDPNNGSEINRHTSRVLLVTTTGGHKLSWSVEECAK